MQLFRNPVGKNLIANIFSIAINLLNQILLVPIFLKFWGTDKYSDWIVITAISSFFTITDIGLNTVTSNQFSISLAENKSKESNELLTNNFLLLGIVSGVIITFVILFLFAFDICKILNIHTLAEKDANIVFLVLILQVFLGMFSTIMNAVYRAFSLASRGIFIDNIGRLCEVMILAIGVISGLSFVTISFLYIIPKIFLFIYKQFDIQKYYPYRFRFKNANKILLKQSVIPSFAFISFPAGNAIIAQGYTVLINTFFSSEVLILFNTTRTLTNFIKTAMGSIATAIWPEFSIAYGKKNYEKMRKLHRYALISSIILTISISLFLLIFGEYIFKIWTQNAVSFNFNLMLAFLIILGANNFWYTSSVVLLATNNHITMGIIYLTTSVVAILIARSIIPTNSIQLITYTTLLVHLILSAYVFNESLIITKDTRKQFLLFLLNIKRHLLKNE